MDRKNRNSEDLSLAPYKRIAERVRRSILRGDYAPGDRLPSVRELAMEEGVNPNTIQNVYGLLEREGWVDQRHGAGTFVREPQTLPNAQKRERVREWLERARREAKLVGLSDEEWRDMNRDFAEEIPLTRGKRKARS